MPDELRAAIVLFFSLLDEKQRRLYAGLEALKTGRGGDGRIAELLGLDDGTVARGRRELLAQDVEVERIRRTGAGRKPVEKNAGSPAARQLRHLHPHHQDQDGPRSTAHLLDRHYDSGVKIDDAKMRALSITWHESLPRWNYSLSHCSI